MFKMIKEAEARIALGDKVTVAEQVRRIIGADSIVEVTHLFAENADPYQITPDDYANWLNVVLDIAAEEGVSANRRQEFLRIAMDYVLDNDPKFDGLAGDVEAIKGKVANTLWTTYKASKSRAQVANDVTKVIDQTREEEEAIAMMKRDCEDEEGGFEQALRAATGTEEEEGGGEGSNDVTDSTDVAACPYPIGSFRAALWHDVNKKHASHPILKRVMQKGKEEEQAVVTPGEETVDDIAMRIMTNDTERYPTSDTGDQTDVEARVDDLESRVRELETDATADPEADLGDFDRAPAKDELNIDYDSLGNDRPGAARVIGVSVPASGKDEDEEVQSLFRKAITAPRKLLSQAVKDVEDEGMAAWKGLQLPKNPHPKNTQAHRAWEKGMKAAAREALGLKGRPVPTSKHARKK